MSCRSFQSWWSCPGGCVHGRRGRRWWEARLDHEQVGVPARVSSACLIGRGTGWQSYRGVHSHDHGQSRKNASTKHDASQGRSPKGMRVEKQGRAGRYVKQNDTAQE